MSKDFIVVIPAFKKNVAFPDDLVKKIAGIKLIDRCIALAKLIADIQNIVVTTDSTEIELICERSLVGCYLDRNVKYQTKSEYINNVLRLLPFDKKKIKKILVLSPYVPNINLEVLQEALIAYKRSSVDCLVPTFNKKNFSNNDIGVSKKITPQEAMMLLEISTFFIISVAFLELFKKNNLKVLRFNLKEEILEIDTYKSWWLAEKLLNRKKIIFRVIAHSKVGMGHLHRSIAVAHEISDHEIYFLCDQESKEAVFKFAGDRYWVESIPKSKILNRIAQIKPDLVINDILDTKSSYIKKLKEKNIRVLNFEDLGTGAMESDVTINDLYENNSEYGGNILWGSNWFILRDEFYTAKHKGGFGIKNILITFGGTDPRGLTKITLDLIINKFISNDSISKINIVIGPGNLHHSEIEELSLKFSNKIKVFKNIDFISKIMEECDIAICSNGRTVYELAQIGIPGIVISQHAREQSHQFASNSKGFTYIGSLDNKAIENKIENELNKLISDKNYYLRKKKSLDKISFLGNKKKVMNVIKELIESS